GRDGTGLTPCRQYEPLRNSLMSWSSVRREMCVEPTVTWDCPPTMRGLWVEVKASSLTGDVSSWEWTEHEVTLTSRSSMTSLTSLTSRASSTEEKGGLSRSCWAMSSLRSGVRITTSYSQVVTSAMDRISCLASGTQGVPLPMPTE
ncbi:hypothetical protein CRUP_010620, partial [Coryphaenoides rupestris]